ncbi:Hint domain-containing protein [Bradyrhizobium sp. WSM471]|uniref:Hint domain-containing protein n=1 Tax=Bradyrhizobium sp. WSM471 TaxID=319017 RepID=UPI0006872882|nr:MULTISPECIES: Hint domain-containing protein [Bradyrhizobium]UFW43409.1 Hint domain-containing protein [Bradyrhizobium canariense]
MAESKGCKKSVFASSFSPTTPPTVIGQTKWPRSGEVAVESLKRGDMVLCSDGQIMPISWIGRQTVSTVFGDKERALPIRVKAGALGPNMPWRDLLVSPDHALLVDDVLIQAGALVNGRVSCCSQ